MILSSDRPAAFRRCSFASAKKVLSFGKSIKRGKKRINGSFYYGAWLINYYTLSDGLIVYTYKWNQLYATIFVLSAVVIIGVVFIVATGGAGAAAGALVFVSNQFFEVTI